MSYNVFADMGMPNPEEELTKARIVSNLRALIIDKGLTHDDTAHRLSLTSFELQGLMRSQWEDYSVDRLLRFVNALDRNVRIIIDAEDVASGEEAQTLVLTA